MSTHVTLSRDCNARVSVREWGALWWRHGARSDPDVRHSGRGQEYRETGEPVTSVAWFDRFAGLVFGARTPLGQRCALVRLFNASLLSDRLLNDRFFDDK